MTKAKQKRQVPAPKEFYITFPADTPLDTIKDVCGIFDNHVDAISDAAEYSAGEHDYIVCRVERILKVAP
jgi:hypothetical protein